MEKVLSMKMKITGGEVSDGCLLEDCGLEGGMLTHGQPHGREVRLLGVSEKHPRNQCLLEGRSMVGLLLALVRSTAESVAMVRTLGMMLHDTERHCSFRPGRGVRLEWGRCRG